MVARIVKPGKLEAFRLHFCIGNRKFLVEAGLFLSFHEFSASFVFNFIGE